MEENINDINKAIFKGNTQSCDIMNDIIKKDMENKINIAELLKNCPKGTELYSPLCGECTLYDVNDYNIRISTPNKDTLICLYHDGRYCANGEIMLFPKGKTTWEGFQRPFVDGDILATKNGLFIGIVKIENGMQRSAYVAINGINDLSRNVSYCFERFATEEEKQKLFDAIKANGYKWNDETKTLEKLIKPKFKVGDKIKKVNGSISGIITNIADDGSYKVEYQGGGISYISLAYQYEWELVPHIKSKFKVGDTIEKYGYKYTITEIKDNYYLTKCRNKIPFEYQDDFSLVPNKFDINTLKPLKSEVLVRDSINVIWKPSFWGKYIEDSNYKYLTTNGSWKQCIPYEGNEHLLGTSNNCDEFYKTW